MMPAHILFLLTVDPNTLSWLIKAASENILTPALKPLGFMPVSLGVLHVLVRSLGFKN